MAIPSTEDLKNLSPEARIKRLKEMEAQRKKELDDTRKQVEGEIAAAEELIKKTEDDLDEETEDEEKKVVERKRKEDEDRQRSEESLEERLARERTTQQEQENRPQYTTTALYSTLDDAAKQLERLYGSTAWNERDQQIYRESKERVERAQTYNLTSSKLEEELDLASGMLNRLKYRR